MKINKNNLFARYYQWIYGNLPNDVCSFFWGSLLAISLFFILVPGRLCQRDNLGLQLAFGVLIWVGYGLCWIMGADFYASVYLGIEEFNTNMIDQLNLSLLYRLLVLPAIGVGILATIVAIALAIVGICYLVYKAFSVTGQVADNTTLVQNTKDFVGAIRRKHCTKINWH